MTLLQAFILLSASFAAVFAFDLENSIINRVMIAILGVAFLFLAGDDFCRVLGVDTLSPENRDLLRTIVYALCLAALVTRVYRGYKYAGQVHHKRNPEPRPLWKGAKQ